MAQKYRICLQCRSDRRLRFDSWVRKIPWRRTWQATPVFLPIQSRQQKSLVGCSHRVRLNCSDLACIHIYICMYVCVCIYIYIYICIYIYTCRYEPETKQTIILNQAKFIDMSTLTWELGFSAVTYVAGSVSNSLPGSWLNLFFQLPQSQCQSSQLRSGSKAYP